MACIYDLKHPPEPVHFPRTPLLHTRKLTTRQQHGSNPIRMEGDQETNSKTRPNATGVTTATMGITWAWHGPWVDERGL